MIQKGHAEPVPENDNVAVGQKSYVPHHNVKHPTKPDKFRVVEDFSSTNNSKLVTGPDQTNNLVAVLMNFRKEEIAVTCDIEEMFYQVGVTPKHRDFLRFLWFEDGDLEKEVKEYRMCVHPFGASSSPACASYALRAVADRFGELYGPEIAEFIRRHFYVDDGIKLVATVEEAKTLT